MLYISLAFEVDNCYGCRPIIYSNSPQKKKHNIQLNENTTEKDFVEMRENRDKTLNAPRLLIPSIQVNIDGGKLPKVEDNGVSYLKVPLKIT